VTKKTRAASNTGFVLGPEAARRLSEIEGIPSSEESDRLFQQLERENADLTTRLRAVLSLHALEPR
jgi:hypothetical protein